LLYAPSFCGTTDIINAAAVSPVLLPPDTNATWLCLWWWVNDVGVGITRDQQPDDKARAVVMALGATLIFPGGTVVVGVGGLRVSLDSVTHCLSNCQAPDSPVLSLKSKLSSFLPIVSATQKAPIV
jgi:hypothetical protein